MNYLHFHMFFSNSMLMNCLVSVRDKESVQVVLLMGILSEIEINGRNCTIGGYLYETLAV